MSERKSATPLFSTASEPRESLMSDFSGHWAEDEIDYVLEKGWMVGDPDGNFRPDDTVTRAELAKVLTNVDETYPPDTEIPPVDPPPDGEYYIPVFQGPILTHDGNPTVRGSYNKTSEGTETITNTLFNGQVRCSKGLLILRNCEVKGGGRDWAVAGWGGRVFLDQCEIWDAEDGLKDDVDTLQTTVHKLRSTNAEPHSDAVQLQGSGSKATHRWSYLNGYYATGSFANSAIIVKNDIGNGALQEITVEDCYLNGGNYTVYLRSGGAGPGPVVSDFKRCFWGGEARYGERSGSARVWDVTKVGA